MIFVNNREIEYRPFIVASANWCSWVAGYIKSTSFCGASAAAFFFSFSACALRANLFGFGPRLEFWLLLTLELLLIFAWFYILTSLKGLIFDSVVLSCWVPCKPLKALPTLLSRRTIFDELITCILASILLLSVVFSAVSACFLPVYHGHCHVEFDFFWAVLAWRGVSSYC